MQRIAFCRLSSTGVSRCEFIAERAVKGEEGCCWDESSAREVRARRDTVELDVRIKAKTEASGVAVDVTSRVVIFEKRAEVSDRERCCRCVPEGTRGIIVGAIFLCRLFYVLDLVSLEVDDIICFAGLETPLLIYRGIDRAQADLSSVVLGMVCSKVKRERVEY